MVRKEMLIWVMLGVGIGLCLVHLWDQPVTAQTGFEWTNAVYPYELHQFLDLDGVPNYFVFNRTTGRADTLHDTQGHSTPFWKASNPPAPYPKYQSMLNEDNYFFLVDVDTGHVYIRPPKTGGLVEVGKPEN